MLEIAEELELPPALARTWSSRGYYGSVSHTVKAIYQRYLGFFDGNPANLNPHPPVEAAHRYVAYMGGAEAILERADFVRERFRPEFVEAFEQWLASEPLVNPDSASSPFAMEEYQLEAAAEAERRTLAADQLAQDGLDHNQTSDDYVLMTVLFAVVLFFVAVGTRFDALRVRIGLISLATVGLTAGIITLLTFPIEI